MKQFRQGKIISKYHIIDILSYSLHTEEIITLIAKTSATTYRFCIQNYNQIIKDSVEKRTLKLQYRADMGMVNFQFDRQSKSYSLKCKAGIQNDMIRAMLNIFKKRRKKGIFGFNDKISIEITTEKETLSLLAENSDILSLINLPMNRSPKIKLALDKLYNRYFDEVNEKGQANKIMFRIFEKLDYVYQLHLEIDESFDISSFPMNKVLRVSKLKLFVRDLEKLAYFVEKWSIVPKNADIYGTEQNPNEKDQGAQIKQYNKFKQIAQQIKQKSREILPEFLENINVITSFGEFIFKNDNEEQINQSNDSEPPISLTQSEQTIAPSSSQDQLTPLENNKQSQQQQICGALEFRKFLMNQHHLIDIDVDLLCLMEDRYLQNYEGPLGNDHIKIILIKCKTLKHHQVFLRKLLQECRDFYLLIIHFISNREDDSLDNDENINEFDYLLKYQKEREFTIYGDIMSNIDVNLCVNLYKSLKTSTKKLQSIIDIQLNKLYNILTNEILNIEFCNIKPKFIARIPTLHNLQRLTITEDRPNYTQDMAIEETLKQAFKLSLQLKQLKCITFSFVRRTALRPFIDAVLEAHKQDLTVKIKNTDREIKDLNSFAFRNGVSIIKKKDQFYKIPVETLQEFSKSCKKAKLDLKNFDAYYTQEEIAQLLKIPNFKIDYKFKSDKSKQIEKILTKAYLR